MRGQRRQSGPFPWKVHPIWRGIGLFMAILIPVIAYGLVETILERAQIGNSELARTLQSPSPWGLDFPVLRVILVVVASFVLYLVFSILGSLLYSLLGGPQNEELAQRTPPNIFRSGRSGR
ncbi:MAG: hypothetical protein ACRDFQ_06845 [Anaerolineales bacterium]